MRKVSCESFEQNTNFCFYAISRKQLRNPATTVPQLSKCLKFEVIGGIKDWHLNKRYSKTRACIVDQRITHHNHLVHLNYNHLSVVKLW